MVWLGYLDQSKVGYLHKQTYHQQFDFKGKATFWTKAHSLVLLNELKDHPFHNENSQVFEYFFVLV